MYIEVRPTIKQLQEVMINDGITTKWYELGIELLDTDNPLKEIKANHPNDVWTCCRQMFQKWLEKTYDASWSQLVTALNKIEMTSAANAISKRYNISGKIHAYHNVSCIK